jgi:hypothetical protein
MSWQRFLALTLGCNDEKVQMMIQSDAIWYWNSWIYDSAATEE